MQIVTNRLMAWLTCSLYFIPLLIFVVSTIQVVRPFRALYELYLNVCPFDYTAFVVNGKVGIPLTGLTTSIEWMLSVAILIDRSNSVPQLLCNRRTLPDG